MCWGKAVLGSGSVEQTGMESGCWLVCDLPLFRDCGQGGVLLARDRGQAGPRVQVCGHVLYHLAQLWRYTSRGDLAMRTI